MLSDLVWIIFIAVTAFIAGLFAALMLFAAW